MNRNLKDDLETVEKAKKFNEVRGWGSKEFHELSPYFSKFHEEGLDIAKHAIERALKAEKALGNETILNGKALAKLKERADKAEALVNKLRSDSKTEEQIKDLDIAVEKQIPRKPQKSTGSLPLYFCPSCGYGFTEQRFGDRYCSYCGQKINWWGIKSRGGTG